MSISPKEIVNSPNPDPDPPADPTPPTPSTHSSYITTNWRLYGRMGPGQLLILTIPPQLG